MAPSDYTTTRNTGQSTTAVSNSIEIPPAFRFREIASDNPTITAAAAQSSCNIPPPLSQGRSQPKCDGGASQLSNTVANLYTIHQYGPNKKLFTLYFLNKSAL